VRGLGEKRLAGFLKTHGYSNGKTAAQLLERLSGSSWNLGRDPHWLMVRR
jgi:hypothetical protein